MEVMKHARFSYHQHQGILYQRAPKQSWSVLLSVASLYQMEATAIKMLWYQLLDSQRGGVYCAIYARHIVLRSVRVCIMDASVCRSSRHASCFQAYQTWVSSKSCIQLALVYVAHTTLDYPCCSSSSAQLTPTREQVVVRYIL